MKDNLVVPDTATSPQADALAPVVRGDAGLASQPGYKLDALREIILGQYRQQITEMQAEIRQLEQLEERVTDPDKLIAIVSPVMSQAIRRTIRDAREEMIEALYPIIGSLVMRAVSEAVRDLARTVDAQARNSFNPAVLWRRFRAWVGGVRDTDLALRDALPFHVAELFLIHQQKGILLLHLSSRPENSPDSDLIGSMLTAIRDFVQDSFGQGKKGQLDEIQYGEQSILIEPATHVYLAALVEGITPAGFRAEMRERVIEISQAHEDVLRNFDGEVAALSGAEPALRSLIGSNQAGQQLGPVQKRIFMGLIGFLMFCGVLSCLAGVWAWQLFSGSAVGLGW